MSSSLRSRGNLQWRQFRDALVALALLSGATLVGLALQGHVGLISLAMVYVLAVVFASYALPRMAAAISAVTAVALLNFFFIPPRFTLQVDAQESVVALFAMLSVALVVSHLGTALRQETEAARSSERRAIALQALAGELAESSQQAQIQALAQQFLARAFPGPCLVSLLAPDGELDLTADAIPTTRDGMLACIREAATLGPGTGRWARLDTWYVPIESEGHMGGAACIRNVSAPDHAGLEHAQAVCALAGHALWRLELAESMHAAEEQSRWHKAQNTFLAAVSHDLRTPLASIMGAASSLQTQRDKLPLMEQERLCALILSEANHLATLAENTLQLVRLENSGDLDRDWQSMEEIVGAVLARVRARDVGRRIRSNVPPRLPLIKADPVLLTQLLENLLDNALKYSADAIDLMVTSTVDVMELAVHDFGIGIPDGEELAIFEPYRRSDRSGQRGAGLGLAVCRAIARAHNGTLEMRRRDRGSSFILTLPVARVQPIPEPA
jgi:two-component system, OmpR family, sensor histidine kinase KdpD